MDDHIEAEFHGAMGHPLVSVVLPVWNGERYLKQTIESILAQHFSDFELVIVDDGSTDDTPKIIESLGRDPRIRCHRQTNMGLVKALNKGLELSRGELIARIDADDYAMPERLALQVKALVENPGVAVIGSSIRVVDENDKMIREVRYEASANTRMEHGCAVAHAAVMFKKDVVVRLGGYREPFLYAEDYDLWLRVSEIAEIRNLQEVLTVVRELASGITKTHGNAQAFRSALAKIAHKRRKIGAADPFSATLHPLQFFDIPGDLSEAEKEAVLIPSLSMKLGDGESAITPELEILLNESWRLRRRLHRGQYVRHCLCPLAFGMVKKGRYVAGLSWFARALITEPLSACWMLFR
jgi:glycosyltransferase involved in cell wall biosynthesis